MNTVRVERLMNQETDEISRMEETLSQKDQSISPSEEAVLQELLQKRKQYRHALKEHDWNALLNLEIEETELGLSNRLYESMMPSQWPSFFTEVSFLEKYKLMREGDMTPILPINFASQRTAYDISYDPPQLEETILHISNKYSSASLNFLNHLFSLSYSLLGAVFFIFLFGDLFTKEGLGRHGPIHFLKTQPLNFNKILASKLIVVLTLSVAILLGAAFISLLLGAVFDRFGHYNYPILIYGEDHTFSFMNLSTMIIQATLLFVMILLFCYALLMLYSIVTKRVALAIGLTLATIFIGTELSEQLIALDLAKYNPFQYFSVVDVVTQEMAATLQNFNVTLTNGLIALSTASAITLLCAYAITHFQHKYDS